MKRFICLACTTLALFGGPVAVFSSELTYTPVNPSFGGNPMNGSYLLGVAQAQNNFKEPTTSSYTQDPLKNFQDSLVRQVLSELSRKIIGDTFGDTGSALGEGFYKIGDYTIDVSTVNGGNVNVTITDIVKGGSTMVEIPTSY